MPDHTKIYLLAASLLLTGCAAPKITPHTNRHSLRHPPSLDTDEYTRGYNIEGTWTQVDWDVFPQKTPWIEPAEVMVSGDKVIFTVKSWSINSETIEDNERQLLGYFYDFDYKNYPRSMFSRKKPGFIILTVNRRDIHIQIITENGVDFLGIGFFYPPIILQKKK